MTFCSKIYLYPLHKQALLQGTRVIPDERMARCGWPVADKLFLFIRATGKKSLGVSDTICEADGPPIHNRQRRLVCWMEQFQAQFS